MSKSLSIRICEACGIKPRVIQDDKLNDIVIYPDFKNNNNNFVKLIEIIHNKIGLSDFLLLMRYDTYSLKQKLLYLIYELLIHRLGYKIILITEIKKIIRKTKWEV